MKKEKRAVNSRYINIKKVKRNKYPKILRIGSVLLLAALVAAAASLYFKYSRIDNNVLPPKQTALSADSSDVSYWSVYENEKYGFSLKHPLYLNVREMEDVGGYLFFVRFEETDFSKDKGVAVGVSDRDLVSEVAKVEEDIKMSGEIETIEKEATEVGTLYTFIPKDKTLETRAVYLLEVEGYTYSISTTPEQIMTVLQNFIYLGRQ